MTRHQPHIVVVGSINMDLVARVERLPQPGETIQATQLHQIPGGKGANQAVAAARLGARCTMIGRVGDDDFGQRLRTGLASSGVEIDHVAVTRDCSSGVALINVDRGGENSITVISGANSALTPGDLRGLHSLIAAADAVLLQLEIPLATVETAVSLARAAGVPTILDTAPAPQCDLPGSLYSADVLSPNRAEASRLTGLPIETLDDAARAARVLRDRGSRCVIVKLGAQGALAVDDQDQLHSIPAPSVTVVDTTAAGDAFTAATALSIAAGRPILEAVRFACAAGALATTKLGAQPSMPTRTAVERLLQARD